MPRTSLKPNPLRRWPICAAVLALALTAAPQPAGAQVVAVVNGSPITSYDIDQRAKLLQTSSRKKPSRQEIIQELVNDRLKIAKAKFYGFSVGEDEVDRAFNSMAQRQGIPPARFKEFLQRSGIAEETVKARIRAELTWTQMVRGKFAASLQVSESDVVNALRERNETSIVGYVYTLYPVVVVVPPGSSDAVVKTKRRTAESLRGQFNSCKEGLDVARAIRDVAVRDPITRSSGDLPEKFRDLLGGMPLGRLTEPEVTSQGLQMFALCQKKESRMDSPVQHQLREKIFADRYERESKKFLEEIRKSAMIEYK